VGALSFSAAAAAASAAFPVGRSGSAGFTWFRVERRRDMVRARDGKC
jgi:hypothetical protein